MTAVSHDHRATGAVRLRPPATDQAGTRDCDSRVRHTLVNNFGRMFKTGCSGGTCPNGLQRAFRRADLSGTTDTFLSLVGLSSMPLARTVPGSSAKTTVGFFPPISSERLNGSRDPRSAAKRQPAEITNPSRPSS